MAAREREPATQRVRPWVMNTPFGATAGSLTFRPEDGREAPSVRTSRRGLLWLVVSVVAVLALVLIGYIFLAWFLRH